eukprot:scaffold43796_cov41-Prasinocladus_malaysianus.AAC.1
MSSCPCHCRAARSCCPDTEYFQCHHYRLRGHHHHPSHEVYPQAFNQPPDRGSAKDSMRGRLGSSTGAHCFI